MKKNTFSMLDENGNEIVYDVLFTFESEETNKNYIVYTDNHKDETGNIDPKSKLEAITTDKEWKVIETILDTLQEEVRNKKNKTEENNEQ